MIFYCKTNVSFLFHIIDNCSCIVNIIFAYYIEEYERITLHQILHNLHQIQTNEGEDTIIIFSLCNIEETKTLILFLSITCKKAHIHDTSKNFQEKMETGKG